MILYRADITLLPVGDGKLLNGTLNKPKNNVSKGFNYNDENIFSGGRPFILNASRLGEGDTFASNYGGYMSREFATGELVLNITALNINQIVLQFDNVRNQFPKSLTINGDSISNTRTRVVYIIPTKGTVQLDIRMSDWNIPTMPYMLCTVSIGLDIKLNRTNLMSYDYTRSEIADNTMPSYGILAQEGKITTKDIDGEFGKLADQNLLTSNIDVKFYVNDKLQASSKTDKWSYINGEYVVSIDLKDSIMRMQNITYKGLQLIAETTLYEIYNELKVYSESKGFVFVPLDTAIATFLRNVTIRYPYFENASLWETWDKFCQLSNLHIVTDKNSKIEMIRYVI